MLEILLAVVRQNRPRQLELVYNKPVIQVSEEDTNDALNTSNYTLIGPSDVERTITSVRSAGPSVVLIDSEEHLVGVDYRIVVENVLATDGDMIPGEDINIQAEGLDVLVEAGDSGVVLDSLFSDNFDRANETLTTPWVTTTTWLVSSNRLTLNSSQAGTPDNRVAAAPAGQTDVYVEVELTTKGADCGVAARYKDSDKSYLLAVVAANGSIYKYNGSSFTLIANNLFGGPFVSGDTIGLNCSNTTLTMYKNGVASASPQTDAHNDGETYHGIYEVFADSQFDNFVIRTPL